MYLVKSLSRDKGSGRYTMYLPLSPYRFLGAKGADTLCICQTPCPERGTLPDTWAIPKHTSGIYPLSHRWSHPEVLLLLFVFWGGCIWPGPSADMCRGFLLYKFRRILAGIFLEIFLGTSSHENEEKIRRQNPRKNPAAQK